MTQHPDHDPPTIRQVSTRTVYQNRWMTVREDAIRRPDGSQGIYGVIDKPDFALVIPHHAGPFHAPEERWRDLANEG